ncbi:hypothetical protein [Paracoccus sp. AS002]|uniref:hypothetical protein n=1 Tax=Paracoccus sp. AS002 TaxID=3019545 RepID=UPI0023E83180|nr:hypothetical protein [Paracoccus sp. AS002]MDF3904657.1 hypothetical protein [Paracoccus sp. AS002]
MDALAPFYRQGRAIPLTATDYANRAGMTLPQAKGMLAKLRRSGAVQRQQTHEAVLFYVREAGQ